MGDPKIRHLGMDIEYYHPDSRNLVLPPETEDLYSVEKEKAQIFIHNSDDQTYSVENLFDHYIARRGLRAVDHVPVEAKKGVLDKFVIGIPVKFSENTFHVITTQGAVDIKSLRIVVEITLDTPTH
ncbi:MAG: hypothetical protein V3R66_02230 [Rhodospirillales bacterium]